VKDANLPACREPLACFDVSGEKRLSPRWHDGGRACRTAVAGRALLRAFGILVILMEDRRDGRQLEWLRSRMKEAAPKALVVAR